MTLLERLEYGALDLTTISQRDLLHAAPDATVLVDGSGRIVFASERVRSVFDYPPEDLVGQPVENLIPERYRQAHRAHRDAYLGMPNPRPMGRAMELFGRRRDGSEFPVEVSLSPVPAADGVLVASAIRDVSERKRTEEMLGRERAYLDSIIRTAPTIVLLLDEEGRIQQMNPYLEQLAGYRASEVVGRDWFETFLPDDDGPEIRRVFAETLERGFNGGYTNAIVTRDGSLRHIEWLAKTLDDGNDGIRGLLCIGHDVTRQLEHETALSDARQEAERANASKSRFLAAASHDLRQPLQSLGLYLSVLTRQLDEPKGLEICTKMRKSLDTMGELLDALLDISRLDSGSVVPEKRDFAIQTVLDRIVTDNVQQAEEKGLDLECSTAECVVHSDPGLLERVLENLVTNAIRYTDDGGVRIACEPVGGRARISVTDTGVGIPERSLERVFDEYYQLDNPVRDRRKGLGLGLSIVRHIARLLDLDLRVTSTVGEGSTFMVDVPLGEAPSAEAGAPDAIMRHEGRDPAVLLVEDDPAVIDATGMLFESAGVRMGTATDGPGALRQVSEGFVPDLLVCDYRLPGMNGIEVIRAVREMLHRPVPAVVMTGDTSAREIQTAGLPDCHVLHKPVDTDRLLSMVEHALGASTRTSPR